jgi:hypothetical protein
VVAAAWVVAATGLVLPTLAPAAGASGAAAKIVAVPSTTPLVVEVGTRAAVGLEALVLDATGGPVSGVTVTFTAPATGPSIEGGFKEGKTDTETTDAEGVATSQVFTANGTSGSYPITATVPGVATAAEFRVTNTPDVPHTLTPPAAAASQSAGVGSELPVPLTATLANGADIPLAGVPVTFTIHDAAASGAGTFGTASATFAGGGTEDLVYTNAEGVAAAPSATANGAAGKYIVTATAPGAAAPAVFSVTNLTAPTGTPGCSTSGTNTTNVHGGYWLAAADGAVYSCGDAPYHKSLANMGITPSKPIVDIAATPDGGGYWEVASDGGIFSFGDAVFYGSMGGKPLNEPIVGLASTQDGKGYYEAASDGGIFSFGDAVFYGSMGGKPLDAPIVAIATTPDGHGYYEVASDGGIFSFGDARFEGSMGGKPLNRPVVGIAVTASGGYYEVASDGGVFSFGAPFHGSTGCLNLDRPITSLAISPNSTTVGTGTACGFTAPQAPGGYQFVADDGGVFSFGNAPFAGSLGGKGITDIVGMANA